MNFRTYCISMSIATLSVIVAAVAVIASTPPAYSQGQIAGVVKVIGTAAGCTFLSAQETGTAIGQPKFYAMVCADGRAVQLIR